MATRRVAPIAVADRSSNRNDNLAYVADVIRRSPQRRRVFEAIYFHKKKRKTVSDVMDATGLSRKRVTEEGAKLHNKGCINKVREKGAILYEMDPWIHSHKAKILALVGNPEKRAALPTKVNPQPAATAGTLLILVPTRAVKVRRLTVDDIRSFRAVRKITEGADGKFPSENRFKEGIKAILSEKGRFTDWGGEGRDLYTTRFRIRSTRQAVAFAFKGPGTKGTLTPGKMGKNGDQIQQLVDCQADAFLVQYHGQVAESVEAQLAQLAQAKSYREQRRIWYGVIDGQDSRRLIAAYPREFGVKP